MASNAEFIVSQLEGIKQAIADKFGDDGLKKKTYPTALASSEQRVWQELAAIQEAIRHTIGGGGSGGGAYDFSTDTANMPEAVGGTNTIPATIA